MLAVKSGALYFTGAFALGFLFGGIRLMLLEPLLGDLLAVLIEVPIMLALCWILCARAIQRLQLPATLSARATMGATAFVLLMLAEAGLAVFLFGNSLTEYANGYEEPARLFGLLGQFLFAVFPIIQMNGQFGASKV